MRIGVFSGSFDPVHTGHAMIANYASQWLGFDEVWLMVSPRNPLKHDSCAPDSCRLEMASIVASGCRNVKVSDFEFSLPLPSYTYHTLSLLRESYPENEFCLIIGSDNWVDFHRWRDHDRIIREFRIFIYERPGYPLSSILPAGVERIDGAPLAFISSTFVRNALKEGRNLNYFLPPGVFEYISQHKLYL